MSFQKLSQIKIILIICGRELCIYLIHVIHIFFKGLYRIDDIVTYAL